MDDLKSGQTSWGEALYATCPHCEKKQVVDEEEYLHSCYHCEEEFEYVLPGEKSI